MANINYAIVRRRLSVERFAAYEAETAGDVGRAFALYEWNMSIGAALFESLGMLEVLLRNALHDVLVKRFPGPPAWYHATPLDKQAKKEVAMAVDRATRRGKDPELSGKVIAELTLGFWRYLTASRYLTSLWVPTLRNAFPGHPSAPKVERRDVEDRLQRLHFLRNRVAHHEPTHRRNLANEYQDLLTVAGWICTDTSDWINDRSRVPQLLAQRP